MVIVNIFQKKRKKTTLSKEEAVQIIKQLEENNAKSPEIFTDKEREFLKKNLFSLKKN